MFIFRSFSSINRHLLRLSQFGDSFHLLSLRLNTGSVLSLSNRSRESRSRSMPKSTSLRFCSEMSTSRFKGSDFSGLKLLDKKDEIMTEARNMDTFLIVGLGNFVSPNTRHSVGMMAVDNLLNYLGSHWEKRRDMVKDHNGLIAESLIATDDHGPSAAQLFLFKPKSLMNISGKSVLKAAKRLDIDADKIYLIHDELDKAVGKFGLKEGGSARGHKGVLSCSECLRSSPLWPRNTDADFKGLTRLRIGIGRPARQSEIVSYVLGHFQKDEMDEINTAINGGLNLLLNHITNRMSSQRQVKTGDDT